MTLGVVGRFFHGVGLVLRGFGHWTSSPRLMLLGMLPALLTIVLFAGVLVGLAFLLDPLIDALTFFAAEWDSGWRSAVRALVAVAIVGGSGVILALSFAAVTLTLGAPFYDRIAETVDERLGPVAGKVDPPFWRSLGRGIVDSGLLVLVAAGSGSVLFLLGLIPVVGGPLAALLGAVVGGWLLAIELTGVAAERRGRRLSGRLTLLRTDRATTLGFGVGAFVLFLIPFGAIVGMPSAVAGATLLVRQLNGEPTSPPVTQRQP